MMILTYNGVLEVEGVMGKEYLGEKGEA